MCVPNVGILLGNVFNQYNKDVLSGFHMKLNISLSKAAATLAMAGFVGQAEATVAPNLSMDSGLRGYTVDAPNLLADIESGAGFDEYSSKTTIQVAPQGGVPSQLSLEAAVDSTDHELEETQDISEIEAEADMAQEGLEIPQSQGAVSDISPEKSEEPSCFIRLPHLEKCLLDSDGIISLGKKAATVLAVQNPVGLLAVSAYRFIATDDSKTEILLDAVAGQGVAAATVISLVNSTSGALKADTDVSADEILAASGLTGPEVKQAVTVLQSGAVLAAVVEAVTSESGAMAGFVDLAIKELPGLAADELGFRPKAINDPNVHIGNRGLESIVEGDASDLFTRKTPSFIEIGSFDFPGANAVYQRSWESSEMQRLADGPETKPSEVKDYSAFHLRDFVYESKNEAGVSTYTGLTVMSSKNGDVLFEGQSGPFQSEKAVMEGMNLIATNVLKSEPAQMLAAGYMPRVGSESLYDAASKFEPSPGSSYMKMRKLENGDALVTTLKVSDERKFTKTDSVYDRFIVDMNPKSMTEQMQLENLLSAKPKSQTEIVTSNPLYAPPAISQVHGDKMVLGM